MKAPLTVSVMASFAICTGCTSKDDHGSNYDVLSREAFACVAPAEEEIQTWGKTGLSKRCIIKDGPFVAVENGHVHLRGQYADGKQAGVWYWYDKDGNETKQFDYSATPPNE